MAALFAAHLLFIKSDNFFRPAGVSRLPVWAALNVQPIAAEDWPVVVVWLGCGFSGRHRESACEYRRFPRGTADAPLPTPSMQVPVVAFDLA